MWYAYLINIINVISNHYKLYKVKIKELINSCRKSFELP